MIVDKLTPNGQIPEHNNLMDLSSGLLKNLIQTKWALKNDDAGTGSTQVTAGVCSKTEGQGRFKLPPSA
jgi:hypothetical protein